eukprot:CAMPEP_0113895100 /NCGR_PEP_ID=MMETSP0780_2-20120614/17146_1 /TAXON_ID=652834 /ORGANISM="Palpitomonas bilix" /LENGTH=166 /DNA_ID=CAMNT_0000885835 /DNA_START=58 /DNA_END=559 /DNA_ORIENTATION=+ /assembly_acc=CAM_ASM_000599
MKLVLPTSSPPAAEEGEGGERRRERRERKRSEEEEVEGDEAEEEGKGWDRHRRCSSWAWWRCTKRVIPFSSLDKASPTLSCSSKSGMKKERIASVMLPTMSDTNEVNLPSSSSSSLTTSPSQPPPAGGLAQVLVCTAAVDAALRLTRNGGGAYGGYVVHYVRLSLK